MYSTVDHANPAVVVEVHPNT